MAVLYDFKCSNDHIHERIASRNTVAVPCPQCSEVAHRIISTVNFSLDPISGDFPKATKNWAKHREYTIKQERKQENS